MVHVSECALPPNRPLLTPFIGVYVPLVAASSLMKRPHSPPTSSSPSPLPSTLSSSVSHPPSHWTAYAHRRPDFAHLASLYAPLAPYVRLNSSGAHVDFRDADATRTLTLALLHVDFGLMLTLPAHQLCPTVPSRVAYLAWAHSLLGEHEDEVCALDIGVGASCIYPLLGWRMYGWRWLGSEVDAASLAYARANVAANAAQGAITLRLASCEDRIAGVLREGESVALSVCNPPFFDNGDAKAVNPHTALAITRSEERTEGGEVSFVRAMIDESVRLGPRVRWCSSLLGRKASLKPLLAHLQRLGIANMRHTAFRLGRTTRWAIAWSHTNDGLHVARLARHRTALASAKLVPLIITATSEDEVRARLETAWRSRGIASQLRSDTVRPQWRCNVYESSPWWRALGDETPAHTEAQGVAIGPAVLSVPVPKLTVEAELLPRQGRAQWRVQCARASGEHSQPLFAALMAELMVELSNAQSKEGVGEEEGKEEGSEGENDVEDEDEEAHA